MADIINIHKNDLPNNLKLIGDLAIDTEAMGLNIKRDRLCLVQIADSNNNIHLVQFTKNTNYVAPNLKRYLEDEKIQKIFHFARFDVAILKHYLQIPSIKNIFCTKIASKFARTYTEHHGLKSLITDLLGAEIKKDHAQTSSNWSNNELTYAQKQYAKNDVEHLHKVRDALIEMLTETNRLETVKKYSNFVDTITEADIMGFTGDIFSHTSSS